MVYWNGERKLLKGNLHLHTTLSDGKKTPEEAMDIYRDAGYDFIAVTDHRKVSTPSVERNGLLAIQGIEFDFAMPGQVMHILGIGVPTEIEDSVQRHYSPQRAIDEINRLGGAAILAHPAWSLNTPAVMASLSGLCAAEIYNTVSQTPWNVDRADSSNLLDECAAAGTIFNFVATDDAHFYAGDECKSYIYLAADENTPQAILRALKAGDFYATRGPKLYSVELNGDTLRVECSPADMIYFPSEAPWTAARVFTGAGLTRAEYKINPVHNRRFVRAVVQDSNGMRAWSNPVPLG